jgi:hypothetical protein
MEKSGVGIFLRPNMHYEQFQINSINSDPQLYGTWFTLGKWIYLFGNKLVKFLYLIHANTILMPNFNLQATWETNLQLCTTMGMIPFVFENQEEFDAVNALTKSKMSKFEFILNRILHLLLYYKSLEK